MNRHRSLVAAALAALVLTLMVAMPASAFAAGKGWSTKVVTRAPVHQQGVVISGERLAWYDGETTPSVYTWKVGQAKPLKFSSTYGFWFPAVSGDRVAWTERWGFAPGSLTVVSGGAYTWTPSTGAAQVGTALASRMKVSGDRLAWDFCTDGTAHVRFYSLLTWTPAEGVTTLPPSPMQMGAPSVSGERVAWSTGFFGDIRTWKAGDATPTVLAANQLWEGDVLVSGDRVVWSASPSGTNLYEDMEIFTWTPASGVVQVTDSDSGIVIGSRNGAVAGDRIVWSDATGGTSSDIYVWTAGTGVEKLSSPATGNVTPGISGERIVWTAGQIGHEQVYTWTPSTDVTAVTADANSNVDPVVSGERIAWRQMRPGGVYQIVTATAPQPRGRR